MVEGAADGASRRLDRRLALAGSVLVASLASLVYLRTLTFGFVYDDLPQVVNNPLLGRSDIWLRAFVDDVWSHHLVGAQYYRPVFLLWLAANYALFEHAAWGWHLTSVAVHAVASVLVLWVGVRLGLERFAAVLAGCLFAVHPAHVESVAWVSGITDPLMTMFLLACLLLHLRWRGGAGRAPLCGLLAPLAFAAALLDKETAVVFVAIILALPFLGLGGRERDHFGLRARCMESLVGASPYVAVVALYLAARAATVGAVGLEGAAALRIELLTAPSLLWQYSLRLFWPMNLSPVYSVDYIERLSARGVAAPAIGVLGLCAASLWSKGSRSLCVLLLGIIALPLAPVLLISKLPLEDFFHDRYLYLPSVGFSLLVAGWVASLPTGKAKLLGQPAGRLGVAVLLVGACAVVTARESAVWRDDLTLFGRAVERAPDNNVALTSYASKLLLAGEISAAQAILPTGDRDGSGSVGSALRSRSRALPASRLRDCARLARARSRGSPAGCRSARASRLRAPLSRPARGGGNVVPTSSRATPARRRHSLRARGCSRGTGSTRRSAGRVRGGTRVESERATSSQPCRCAQPAFGGGVVGSLHLHRAVPVVVHHAEEAEPLCGVVAQLMGL